MGTVFVDVTIQGVTPLLCNRFTDEQQQNATNGTRSAMKGSGGTPKEQAEVKLYLGDDGKPVIPQPNIYRCVIDGGAFFKLGKNKITTQKSSLVPACVDLDGLAFPIHHKEPWMVDERPIRNPATGGRRLCWRPRFNDWQISFTLACDTEMMSTKLLRDILDAAGKKIGLGDFRPSCKGPFGKFVVTSWKEREAKVAA